MRIFTRKSKDISGRRHPSTPIPAQGEKMFLKESKEIFKEPGSRPRGAGGGLSLVCICCHSSSVTTPHPNPRLSADLSPSLEVVRVTSEEGHGVVLPSPIKKQFRGKVTNTDMLPGYLSPNLAPTPTS